MTAAHTLLGLLAAGLAVWLVRWIWYADYHRPAPQPRPSPWSGSWPERPRTASARLWYWEDDIGPDYPGRILITWDDTDDGLGTELTIGMGRGLRTLRLTRRESVVPPDCDN